MRCWLGLLPPGAQQERDDGEQHVHDERDRRRVEQNRADRQVIEQAAAQLRLGAIWAGYAGMEQKHLAFGLALVLDELALHLRDLDADLCVQVLAGARMLTEGLNGLPTARRPTPSSGRRPDKRPSGGC